MTLYRYCGAAGSNPDLGFLTPGQALEDAALAPGVLDKFKAGGLVRLAPDAAPAAQAAGTGNPEPGTQNRS